MIRVVLDTNILVSGIFWRGNPYKILQTCFQNKLSLIISPAILEELQDVLRTEKKFELTKNDISSYMRLLISHSTLIEPVQTIDAIKDDPDDNMILECAAEGKADYIISGDKHLLSLNEYSGIKILSAREFLQNVDE
ncbi:MAG: putative toxin-antitoxin system toxin component, PIN family [Candidatus Methanofastidiosia archaeon]